MNPGCRGCSELRSHSSLGDRVRPCLSEKKRRKKGGREMKIREENVKEKESQSVIKKKNERTERDRETQTEMWEIK